MKTLKLFLPLLLLAFPAVMQAQFTFTTNNGAITITAYTGSGGVVSIPGTTNGYTVVSIGQQAFENCTNLTSVIIPNNVTNVGDYAFEDCTNLTSAYFPSNAPPDDGTVFLGDPVTVYYLSGATGWAAMFGGAPTVEETAATQFNYSTNHNSITITDYTGPGGTVVIPDLINDYAVTSIGTNAFNGSTSLTSITIPDSVTNIGKDAFAFCYYLTSVTIPNSINQLGEELFLYCTSLTNIIIPNSVTSIGEGAFAFCHDLNIIIIPGSVTSIGEDAFDGCASLSSVTIPDSVTSIGDSAFLQSGLTSVTISGSITNIEDYAFAYCYSLTRVYFKSNAPTVDFTVFQDVPAIFYYLPGTTGWPTFNAKSGLNPAMLWNPQAQNDASFGVQNSQFGFNITGPTNATIVVEASTTLTNPIWIPIATNTLTGSTSYFSDPQWTNYPGRYYRFSSP